MNIKNIDEAKHILIKTDNESFANASALYSYVLTLHKKVSIVSSEALDVNLDFLPWYDKVRLSSPSSADLSIEAVSDTQTLLDFFKTNEIKINQKMATALYASLLIEFDYFKSSECNGMVFAAAKELIELKAEYKLCRENLLKRVPLSLFRLKALLFKNMLLVKDASCVEVFISDDELKSAGCVLSDVNSILDEILTLVNVKEVTLFKSDENNKIIKNMKEM